VPETPRDPVPADPGPSGLRSIPGYEALGLLGRGGFGEILAARRLADGRPVAVKVARVELGRAREQIRREGLALRGLGPPLVPELIEEGVLADDAPYLALERISAPSLAERLSAIGGPMEPDELREQAMALADALAALHARGWAHGDLKPGHVLLADGAVRLLDFGLAVRPADPGARPVVPAGAYAGTAPYMAPEQVRGGPVDARSDVYAAGAILFEMATGRPPFEGAPGEVRQAHLALRPPRPSDLAALPDPVEEVVLRCLAKDPVSRYADGAALRGALAAAFARPGPARPPSRRPGAPAVSRRLVGVLRFESGADLLSVKRASEAVGGRLAHVAAGRYAVVFEPGARDNAVRLAIDAAGAAIDAGLAPRALVDLAQATAVEGAAGARYVGLPDRPEDWPRPGDPAGTLLTARAGAVVPEAAVEPLPGREGVLRLVPAGLAGGPARGPLLGREGVLAEILAGADAALTGPAPTVFAVTGEAGIGKTHLAGELAVRLRRHSASPEVVEVRGREVVAGEDDTLRALLAWSLGVPAAARPADGGRTLLATSLPAGLETDAWAPVALALGWLPADAAPLRTWRAAPAALRAAAVRAAGEALRARARTRPLCVLVDDAHLADSAALDALEYAALAEAGVPIFVCALGRPALARARPGLGERAARGRTVEMEPLGDADAAELCRRLLLPAENVPGRAVERLVARARGLPILLVELVRGLRAQGLVRQRGHDGGWYVATDELDRVPDMPLVDWLAQREMAALPEPLSAQVRLVALLGDELRREEIAGVVAELDREGAGGTIALDPEVATRRLLELRVLAERSGRIGFRHPLQREAVARSAAEPERRAVHRAAFRYYLLAAAIPERERLPRLAFHAEESGLRAEAASLWLRIAEDLRARHAYLEAETLHTRALDQLAADDSRGRFVALRGRGLVRYRLGRYEDAIADLVAAQGRARALRDPAGEVECLLDEATALDWMNDYARSAERVEAAVELAGPHPAPLAAARIALARGRTLLRAARWPEAAAALEAAAARAETLGDEGYETLVVGLLLLGFLLPHLGRAEEAERVLSRSLSLASARGDALHVAAALNNRRNLWVARGALDRAVDDLAGFLRIGRDLGMVGIEYLGRFNLGELLYQAADLEAAEGHVLRAVEIERRHPEVAARPLARLLWSRLLAHRGDLEGARRLIGEVREVEEEARRDARGGALLGPSDRILARMVELASRDGGEAEWRELCARAREESVEQEPIEVHEMWGLAALRAGRRAEAEAALREALRLAGEIPNVMGGRLGSALARL
jgi:tetratricopeptide (TPR) repeat protein